MVERSEWMVVVVMRIGDLDGEFSVTSLSKLSVLGVSSALKIRLYSG